jgi:hypothetical protein
MHGVNKKIWIEQCRAKEYPFSAVKLSGSEGEKRKILDGTNAAQIHSEIAAQKSKSDDVDHGKKKICNASNGQRNSYKLKNQRIKSLFMFFSRRSSWSIRCDGGGFGKDLLISG